MGEAISRLEKLEQQATMGSKEGGKHQRLYSHQLYQDVQRWSRRILQRIPHRVPNHRCLVCIRSLRSQSPRMLRNTRLPPSSLNHYNLKCFDAMDIYEAAPMKKGPVGTIPLCISWRCPKHRQCWMRR